jgi:hypothetical protein
LPAKEETPMDRMRMTPGKIITQSKRYEFLAMRSDQKVVFVSEKTGIKDDNKHHPLVC